MQSAKAFIFDFYGTLVEDGTVIPPMWQQLNQLGYNSGPELQAIFEPDAFDGWLTPHLHSDPTHDEWNKENWRQLVRLSGVPDSLLEDVLTSLLEWQSQFTLKAASCSVSIIEFLRARGVKIGLCSNWETPIEPYLIRSSLPRFDAISISAAVGARKPHPVIFNDICSKLEVEPCEGVFVGDNWSADIVGALRSGLSPVWIRHGQPSRGLSHLIPEFDTLADLESHLRELL